MSSKHHVTLPNIHNDTNSFAGVYICWDYCVFNDLRLSNGVACGKLIQSGSVQLEARVSKQPGRGLISSAHPPNPPFSRYTHGYYVISIIHTVALSMDKNWVRHLCPPNLNPAK